MRRDQREFLAREFAELAEMWKRDIEGTGRPSPTAVSFICSAECVRDWLRGEKGPSPDLLAFLRQRLEETDTELNYPQVLKSVYEHEAHVAAIAALS